MSDVLNDLYEIISYRKENPQQGSYTNYLFEKGLDKILKKVGEESTEVIVASKGNNKEEQISELCDLTYHLLVLIVQQGISLEDIKSELIERQKKIGNLKSERKEINIL